MLQYGYEWRYKHCQLCGDADVAAAALPKCRWRAHDYVEFRRYSVDELGRHKLGTRRPPLRRSADLFAVKSRRRHHLPDGFDARLRWPGWISTPTDQGSCGASWAFSTASQSPHVWLNHKWPTQRDSGGNSLGQWPGFGDRGRDGVKGKREGKRKSCGGKGMREERRG